MRLSIEVGQRDILSQRARARAATFDWKLSAGRLLSLYEEAIRSPKRDTAAALLEAVH
jgi:hypothetical protein